MSGWGEYDGECYALEDFNQMALIPPFFLDCVVALGVDEGEGKTRWIASGFFLGDLAKPEPDGRNIYHVALVTNRHVFGKLKHLKVRANPTATAPAKEFSLDLVDPKTGEQCWYGHPDVDVAVIPIAFKTLLDHGIRIGAFLSDQHVAGRAKAIELGLTEGDGVFALGFPLGLVGEERNFVIVRQGAIARIRDTLAGTSKEFLVDMSIFPGNSGGPVVSRPETTAIQGTKPQPAAYLLGIVKSYVPYRDLAISS